MIYRYAYTIKEACKMRDAARLLGAHRIFVVAYGIWEDRKGHSIFANGEVDWGDMDTPNKVWLRVKVDGEWVEARMAEDDRNPGQFCIGFEIA